MAHAGIELLRSFLADAGMFEGSIDEQRRAMDAASVGSPPPADVAVEPGRLGDRPVEWLVPTGADRGAAVLYLHGGGYCVGSLDSHRNLAGRIARAAGVPVVSLDYRLAPEHPHPAALHDALSACAALRDDGVAPARTGIAGDSAGGGLTVATLQALRSAGRPLPAAAVCLSPWVDLTQSAPSFAEVGALDPMTSKEALDGLADAYRAGIDATDPGVSPLLGDLAGLPPLRIDVGECEVLRDDSLRLAERARAAGVPVELVRWPDMIHVFQAFPGELLPESDASVEGIGAFLADRLSAR